MQKGSRFLRRFRFFKSWALLLPVIWLQACNSNNIHEDASLGNDFTQHGVTGSFALFDNGAGSFTTYHFKQYLDSAYQPNATFNIVTALIGLQTGTIANERMVIPLTPAAVTQGNNDSSNHSPNFDTAMAHNITAYFQEVARRTGKEKMQFWLDSLKYGNHLIGNSVDSFWMNNTLTITADEQLGLIKRLYFGQLPFDKTWQVLIKRLLMKENNANYQLAYITGEGVLPNQQQIGWVLGWIEENKHPYFFVLNTEAPGNVALAATNLQLSRDLLSHLGFFKGKK